MRHNCRIIHQIALKYNISLLCEYQRKALFVTSVCDETDLMLTICLPSKFVNSRKHKIFIYRDITIYLFNYEHLSFFFFYNV